MIQGVFDSASEFDGMSLIKLLLTGTDLFNNLIGIIYIIRIDADIEAMYRQLKVLQDDADLLRFFWQDDINDGNPEICQMIVHFFGGKDSHSREKYARKRFKTNNFVSTLRHK